MEDDGFFHDLISSRVVQAAAQCPRPMSTSEPVPTVSTAQLVQPTHHGAFFKEYYTLSDSAVSNSIQSQ